MDRRATANPAGESPVSPPQSPSAQKALPAVQAEKAESRRIVGLNLPDAARELEDLRAGLLAPEARIACKYFYDAAGCALYADICRSPEYYLTRSETAIFNRQRAQMAAHLPSGAQWVDLGCGDGRKSHPWLAAIGARRFVAVDFARDSLLAAVDMAARLFPLVDCLGVVTDLCQPFDLRPIVAERAWPTVFFYPGSSLGNFAPADAVSLLSGIRAHLDEDGALLIGIDLVKEAALLEAAYDDDQGITAAFNRNILRVVNRLLGADFDPDQFEHSAHFAADAGRIEMRLSARRALAVRIGTQVRRFASGEAILTEYAHKYSVDAFFAMLDEAGFSRQQVWTDERAWFAVFLAQP